MQSGKLKDSLQRKDLEIMQQKIELNSFKIDHQQVIDEKDICIAKLERQLEESLKTLATLQQLAEKTKTKLESNIKDLDATKLKLEEMRKAKDQQEIELKV